MNTDDTAEFVAGYAHAMLWANTTNAGDSPGRDYDSPVDPAWWQTPADGWEVRAFDYPSQVRIWRECEEFIACNLPDLAGLDARQCGHDFALTRNRHGTGFWDRGLGDVGDRLTDAAHAYGESTASFTDDQPVTLDSL